MGQMKRREKREEERWVAEGALCTACKRYIGQPDAPGMRYCAGCAPKPTYRCSMRYEFCLEFWRVTVSQDRRILRELTFESEHKLQEMARRGGALRNLADKQALEYGIRNRIGAIDLYLTAEQIAKLRR